MTRTEALRQIAQLHETWSLRHGDEVPNLGCEPEWQADMYAPANADNLLNEKIITILEQVED